MSNRYRALLIVFTASLAAFAQQTPRAQSKPVSPASEQTSPAKNPDQPAQPSSKNAPGVAAAPAAKKAPDKAAAYYHYSMAHIYEELVSIYGRSELASKAIEEYRLAIENDPGSEYLNAGLAELYAKTGRIRDAVLEAQDIIKRDPKNLEARKLLGRIYLRSLGDMQAGTQSSQILKLALEQYEQITALEPKNIENHLLLGRLFRLNNELLKAENEFKTSIQLQPDSEEAVTSLAYLYNEEGDSKRAIAALNSIPEPARSAKLYSALGFTYEQQKDYKNAIAAYKKAVDQDHDNLDAMRGLAQNLMNDGQTDAALEQFKAIADANPEDAQTYLRMAELYRRAGKFDLALETLKKAEAIVQDSLEVPYSKALILEAQGRFEEAAQILQQLLQKSEKPEGNYTSGERNNRGVFLERLGNIYRETGKTQQAVESFRKMLALGDETASRGYQQTIETYRDAKNWSAASATAQEAVAKLPQDRTLRLMQASQLADSGQADAAIAQVKSLLKGKPEDREVYIALAQINSRLRRWKDSEEAIARAEQLSIKPEEKDYVAFVQGSMYERQKKYEQAEQAFRRVLVGDPNNAVALNYLGYMLADRSQRLDEALALIKKAIQLDPQNGAYLDSLGWAYFKMGKYELAEENLRKASDRITNDATIQDHLGDLYQKTGRLKLAAAHWERALEEWNRAVPPEVDSADVAKVQKKLESAKVKLARQGSADKD